LSLKNGQSGSSGTTIYRKKVSGLMAEGVDLSAINLLKIDLETLRDELIDKFIDSKHITYEDKEPLKKEWESFVTAINNGERPRVSGEEALHAIEVAERINSSIKEFCGKWVK